MCGIAGFAGFEDGALLERMVASLAHRGPDDSGTFSAGPVSLGARRLAVIDPAGGHQPMVGESGATAVVLNGEVYNHRALRAWLEERGHAFSSACDTEVAVHGIEEEGASFLRRMEGMFALAAWDGRRLVLARDRLGVKPLLVARRGEALLFASEAKALLKDPSLPRGLDREALAQRFAVGYPLGGRTLFAGIRSLPPGTFLSWDPCDGSVREEAFWHLPPRSSGPRSLAAGAAALGSALDEAVSSQLAADVPLGVFLSGGVDSSLVAALAARRLDRPPRTFALGESARDPDVAAAREVAGALGTDHTELVVEPEEVARNVPRFVLHSEGPNHESTFFLVLSEAVRRHVTVALCGQGADELFGGYPRYRSPRRHAAEVLCTLAAASRGEAWEAAIRSSLERVRAPTDLMDLDLGPQLSEFQLAVVDRASMAVGLEVRVPYLATPVVELSRRLAPPLLVGRGADKAVLRRLARGLLPAGIAARPKRGAGPFTTPRGALLFEAQAARLMDDRRLAAHPLKRFFRRRSELVCMDILVGLLLEGDGTLPQGFAPGDLY